jgi:Domain of unknown function (DUF1772)
MDVWAILMVMTAGLFAGGVLVIAWERIPVWRRMPPDRFRVDFAAVIRRADMIQPSLLVVAIVATGGFAFTQVGAARALALVGGIGFSLTLLASVAILVPLQRRIIAGRVEASDAVRRRWFLGHLGRTGVSMTSFLLVAAAAAI